MDSRSAATFPSESPGSMATHFLDMVAGPRFPCVGSKSALSRGAIETHEFGPLGMRGNDPALLDRIGSFARRIEAAVAGDRTVHSLVALFDGPCDTDEARFEALLWAQLQRLHDLDVRRGTRWAEDVSPDPREPDFSLSLAGHPFFVIGLHPGASRIARRFPWPALVFNSHRQFEQLRADGRYRKMQGVIRERDRALQGDINPNLADFGAISEARQYSGRATEPGWQCPLRVRTP